MRELGKFWAIAPRKFAIELILNGKIAAAHRLDIAGVASSILATPTIENPVKSTVWRGFCCDKRLRVAASQLGVDPNVDQ